MCGRYTLRARLNLLLPLYAAESRIAWEPRFNIAPTQPVVAVRALPESSSRELVLLRWGLIPSWAEDARIGNRMINARAETLAEKPSFKTALKRRRCLILADGFYEWKKAGKTKQPYFIRRKDDRPFPFAGLWDRWRKSDPPIESCTIITTSANALLSELHERMPVILSEADAQVWLDQEIEQPEPLLPLLAPYQGDDMHASLVSTLVNSPQHDSPECLDPPRPQ
jgi:putative SOS response-associated peptidase YedK